MDVKDFCFMGYTFLQILQALLTKQKELEDIYKVIHSNNFNNMNNDILNSRNLYEITNKYIKCLSLFLLNHLFIYNTNDFIPLIISNNNNPRKRNNNKMSAPQESLILVSLFKLISSIYLENNKNIYNNNSNNDNLDNDALIMFNAIFSEYLNNNIDIETRILGSLNEILMKDLRFYLSYNSKKSIFI